MNYNWATAILLLACNVPLLAGTNIVTSKSATADHSVFVSFSTDSHGQYGSLLHCPARTGTGDSVQLKIFDPKTGELRGSITQPPQSYSVTGIVNERQVAIAECTFDCRTELVTSEGVLDYTNLILYTLQQAKSARSAIKLITTLAERYGYYGLGECLSICDAQESWIMEFVGKGNGRKGLLWVALRVPEGYISAQANTSRIGTFPLNDFSVCMYAADIVSYARDKKFFRGKDADFSFRDAYAPMSYEDFIWGEARIWSIFSRVAPSQKLPCIYIRNTTPSLLPLWIKPDKMLALADMKALMRNHYEGTPLDMTKGDAAGAYGLPYRTMPLAWQEDSIANYHLRPISVQHTVCSGVAQLRHWLPGPLGGVLWFGVDDSYLTVYQPMYCGILSAPRSLRPSEQSGSIWEAQYWTFNLVSNYVYTRYRDMSPLVVKEQTESEKRLRLSLSAMDDIAAELYIVQPDSARRLITQYCDSVAQAANTQRQQVWIQLLGQFPPNGKSPLGQRFAAPRTAPAIQKQIK